MFSDFKLPAGVRILRVYVTWEEYSELHPTRIPPRSRSASEVSSATVTEEEEVEGHTYTQQDSQCDRHTKQTASKNASGQDKTIDVSERQNKSQILDEVNMSCSKIRVDCDHHEEQLPDLGDSEYEGACSALPTHEDESLPLLTVESQTPASLVSSIECSPLVEEANHKLNNISATDNQQLTCHMTHFTDSHPTHCHNENHHGRCGQLYQVEAVWEDCTECGRHTCDAAKSSTNCNNINSAHRTTSQIEASKMNHDSKATNVSLESQTKTVSNQEQYDPKNSNLNNQRVSDEVTEVEQKQSHQSRWESTNLTLTDNNCLSCSGSGDNLSDATDSSQASSKPGLQTAKLFKNLKEKVSQTSPIETYHSIIRGLNRTNSDELYADVQQINGNGHDLQNELVQTKQKDISSPYKLHAVNTTEPLNEECDIDLRNLNVCVDSGSLKIECHVPDCQSASLQASHGDTEGTFSTSSHTGDENHASHKKRSVSFKEPHLNTAANHTATTFTKPKPKRKHKHKSTKLLKKSDAKKDVNQNLLDLDLYIQSNSDLLLLLLLDKDAGKEESNIKALVSSFD